MYRSDAIHFNQINNKMQNKKEVSKVKNKETAAAFDLTYRKCLFSMT